MSKAGLYNALICGFCTLLVASGMSLIPLGGSAQAQNWTNRYVPSGPYGGYGYHPRVHYPRPESSITRRNVVRPAPAGIESLRAGAMAERRLRPFTYHRMPPDVGLADPSQPLPAARLHR